MDQKEGEPTRIFIKDRESKKRCYQIFEKNASGQKVNADLYNVDEVDKFNRFYKRD